MDTETFIKCYLCSVRLGLPLGMLPRDMIRTIVTLLHRRNYHEAIVSKRQLYYINSARMAICKLQIPDGFELLLKIPTESQIKTIRIPSWIEVEMKKCISGEPLRPFNSFVAIINDENQLHGFSDEFKHKKTCYEWNTIIFSLYELNTGYDVVLDSECGNDDCIGSFEGSINKKDIYFYYQREKPSITKN